MFIAKGSYTNGRIELDQPLPDSVRQADVEVLVWPRDAAQSSPVSDGPRIKAMAQELAREYYRTVHYPRQSAVFKPGDRIPYAGRVFDEKELANLVDASLDFWLTAGDYSARFEKKFCAFLGCKYSSLVNSGSSANLLAFMALTSPALLERRIAPGDEVITVAAGFPTTIAPLVQYGAIPVFVDVSIPSYNIDASQLANALSPRTRAVMLAHTMGNPFPVAAVKSFCDEHHLWLIEDNCDALGSRYRLTGEWKLTGTFGHIGTSSFYPPHHITMGEGGAVYTDDPHLKRLIDSFRDWGRDCSCAPGSDNSCGKRFSGAFGDLPKGYDHKYVYSHFGYNLKATDLQAAIGYAQLDKLPFFTLARRHHWELLKEGLAPFRESLILPEAEPDADPSWFGFVITLRDSCKIGREAVTKFLESKGIQTRLLFAGNILRQPCFKDFVKRGAGYRVIGDLVNTDIITRNTFWIGVYPGMTEEMISYMIECIKQAIA
jgi:CDP-6-deoxy-D-xylo-4-hexulose-3-dehydrase